jgi:hypothetical protein
MTGRWLAPGLALRQGGELGQLEQLVVMLCMPSLVSHGRVRRYAAKQAASPIPSPISSALTRRQIIWECFQEL